MKKMGFQNYPFIVVVVVM